MWLRVSLPPFAATGASIRIAQRHAATGDRLDRGAPLVDVTVDFSAGVFRDCPPVMTFRIVMQEAAWLRHLEILPGEAATPDAPIALLSTDATSAPEPAAREARVTMASILHHDDWWTSGA